MWPVVVFLGAFVLLVVVVAAVRTRQGPRTSSRPRDREGTSHETAKALGSHVSRGPWR